MVDVIAAEAVVNPITNQTIVQGKSPGFRAPAAVAQAGVSPAPAKRRRRRPNREHLADLRLSRDRGLAQLVASRRKDLPPHERALVDQVFTLGRTVSSIAGLTGEPVRKVRRRIKKLLERMARPEFDAVIAHSDAWPRDMVRLGHAVFVRGLSIRDAARELRMPYYAARAHAQGVRSVALTIARKARNEEAA